MKQNKYTFTSGPWKAYEQTDPTYGTYAYWIDKAEANVEGSNMKANAALIAAAPELYEALKAVEWVVVDFDGVGCLFCPFCYAVEGSKHAKDCELSNALAKARGENVVTTEHNQDESGE